MTEQTVEQFGSEMLEKARRLPAQIKAQVLRTMANYELREIRENFRREEDPAGTPWPELSPVTLKVRKTQGRMLGAGAVQLVRSTVVDDETVAVGTNDPILAIHHDGARMKVTARQSVWMYHNLFGGGEGFDRDAQGRFLKKSERRRANPFGMVGKILEIPQRRGVGFGPDDPAALEEIAVRWLHRKVSTR